MNKKTWKVTGLIIFSLALLLGLALNGVSSWIDLEGMSFWGYPEATSYDPSMPTDGELSGLTCPLVVNFSESPTVFVKVRNPKDYEIRPIVQASVSIPGGMDEVVRYVQDLVIPPNQTVTVSWQAGSENIISNRAVFVRVFLFQGPNYPPSITRHCGILAVNSGHLSSTMFVVFLTGIIFVGMLAGYLLWIKSLDRLERDTNKIKGALLWLIGMILFATLANIVGWMVLAGVLLVLTVLSLIALMESAALGKLK